MQTKKQSAIEALAGTAVGFIVAMCGQIFITWHYGIATSLAQDAWITLFFTGLSIIRGYGVRRFFNWIWRT